MDAATIFGQVLRELRKKKGLSQEALALECNLDRTYISLMERGLRQPSLSTILIVAIPLETSASLIVKLVEERVDLQKKRSNP